MKMPKRRPKGMVFVSYAHADHQRVEPLVQFLAERFNVSWDRGIEVGNNWRQWLMEQLDSARCLVVVWTAQSVRREFIWSEVERVKERGIVVPVKLDRNAQIPLGFDTMQHLDLTRWNGRATKVVEPLLERISKLLARPSRQRTGWNLSNSQWVVDQSVNATRELRGLSDKVATISGVLIRKRGPVNDVVGTLEEVHRTYDAVSGAINRFLSPVARAGKIKVKPYLDMERGSLTTLIRNNRGHCSRIQEYYIRVGGLRDWLEPQFTPKELESVDEAFRKLSTADGDLFAQLEQIGVALTEEASEIAGLLLSGQDDMARERIVEGRNKLIPVERELAVAMSELQQIESSLGHVSRVGRPKHRTRR